MLAITLSADDHDPEHLSLPRSHVCAPEPNHLFYLVSIYPLICLYGLVHVL